MDEPETKVKALEKLGKFRPKIGYPDKWRDYSALQTTADDLYGNVGGLLSSSEIMSFPRLESR
jgi:putative endopeptidase